MTIFNTWTLFITTEELRDTTQISSLKNLDNPQLEALIYKAQASIISFVDIEYNDDTAFDLKKATFYTVEFQYHPWKKTSIINWQVTSNKAWDRQVTYAQNSEKRAEIESFWIPMQAYDILKKYTQKVYKQIVW